MSQTETNTSKLAILENADLLRIIRDYLIDVQLPFVLSFKAVREALKPLNHISGEIWIISKKKYFVTSVSMVEWAQSLGCEFNLTRYGNNLFTYSATNGSVDVLSWAHQQYPPKQYPAGVGEYVRYGAAVNGHIEVLEYLQSLGNIVNWNRHVCKYAAQGGHIHVLQWLREVLDPPCPWSEWTCTNAAKKGHLHILKWLRAQDPPCPWSESTCDGAAMKGHLYILQWLRAQDPPCPWSEYTCSNAAEEGHLQILKWLRAQDPPCPWSGYTCYYVAMNGHLEALKWLRSQDPPCPWWKQRCINQARNNQHHDIVEWILSRPE